MLLFNGITCDDFILLFIATSKAWGVNCGSVCSTPSCYPPILMSSGVNNKYGVEIFSIPSTASSDGRVMLSTPIGASFFEPLHDLSNLVTCRTIYPYKIVVSWTTSDILLYGSCWWRPSNIWLQLLRLEVWTMSLYLAILSLIALLFICKSPMRAKPILHPL
jgi:hypothetical protein